MLRTLSCDGNILIIEPTAAGNLQPPWPFKQVSLMIAEINPPNRKRRIRL